MNNENNPTTPDASHQMVSYDTRHDNYGMRPPKKHQPLPGKVKSAFKITGMVSLCVILSLVSGWLGAKFYYNVVQSGSTSLNQSIDGNAYSTSEEKSISNVAEKVNDSVVSIVGDSTSDSNSAFSFSDGSTTSEVAGTGIIISSDGYIMTNYHVIADTSSLYVVLADGTKYDNVSVIGHDPLNDIAFLKIKDVNGLTPVALGDSSTVHIGQQVVAIGNALGQYQNSVTTGIISGLGRPVTASDESGSTQESLTDLLQTDAAINSGNSGGPLVNLSGQVIGINTAVASDANSIGFSIPINTAKGLMAGVLRDGKIEKAYLGVSYVNITADVASQYKLTQKQGAYVYTSNGNAVASGSPADKAGLEAGDIITKVDDYTVGKTAGLSSIIGLYKPGDKITLTIIRKGVTMTKTVTLTQYQSSGSSE